MSKQQRLVLWISILASFVAFLDGSVVNVALPAIARELGGGLAAQQWVVDAYLITLGALILIAGSLSDLFGRKRILVAGLGGFGIASILCAVAPTSGFLIAARGLQGIAGALLVPSSLALIISSFSGEGQGKAIGTWTAWTGIAFLIGPLIGGFFVDTISWRLVFAINVLPIALTLWLISRLAQKEQIREGATVDWVGAAACALGLGGPVYALIEQPHYGWLNPVILAPLVLGLAILAWFIWYEGKVEEAMLPLELFNVRNFSFGNLATTAVYAGLSLATFVVVVFVQQAAHYTAMEAGLAMVPVTIIMFLLSSRFGALSGKFGPRWFMTFGPIVGAIGFLLMLRTTADVNYWTQLLPGVLVFGLGLTMTVAPLTSAVLGDVKPAHAGVASAVNNAVARIAGLIAVAAIGVITGSRLDTLDGFQRGVWAIALLLVVGGVISAIGIRKSPHAEAVPETAPA